MEHFTRATFRFLRDLEAHNDKQWFHAHNHEYDAHVRGPALALVPAWQQHLPDDYQGRATKQGGAVSPPHRDLRFARDKTPYRTHVAIRMRHRFALPGAPGPTFLLWIAPGGSLVVGGVRNVAGEARQRITAAIRADPEGWLHARAGLSLYDDLRPGTTDPELGDDLRRRHYTAEVKVPQRVLMSTGMVEHVAQVSQRLLPLNQFLAGALYGAR